MHIGIYGGAFDPPHAAHVMAVGYALSVGDFDRIMVIPCWKHAFGKNLSSFDDRYEMSVKAFNIYGFRVSVSPVESQLQCSHTYDLIDYLIQTYPDDDFSLIMGEDEHQVFDKWYKHDEIRRRVRLFVVGRGGYSTEGVLKMPTLSSSDIREKIASVGVATVADLVPQTVRTYIKKHDLYKNPA
jgi:nicotinate-nucleotide adenylyltransferase